MCPARCTYLSAPRFLPLVTLLPQHKKIRHISQIMDENIDCGASPWPQQQQNGRCHRLSLLCTSSARTTQPNDDICMPISVGLAACIYVYIVVVQLRSIFPYHPWCVCTAVPIYTHVRVDFVLILLLYIRHSRQVLVLPTRSLYSYDAKVKKGTYFLENLLLTIE